MTGSRESLDELLPVDVVRGVPEGLAWQRVDDLLATGSVGRGIDAVQRGVGRRDVATSFFGSWLVNPIVIASAASVLIGLRSPAMAPGTVYLRWHPSGWFDGVALTDGESGDAARMGDLDRGEGVAGREVVREHWARQLVGVVGPLLDAAASEGSFGLRGLWGNGVTDRLFQLATDLGQAGHGDPHRLVEEAGRMVDALEPYAPVRLPAGRVFPVPHGSRRVLFTVKSCCCLLYRTVPAEERADADYCTGCPLVPDEGRTARWTAFLSIGGDP